MAPPRVGVRITPGRACRSKWCSHRICVNRAIAEHSSLQADTVSERPEPPALLVKPLTSHWHRLDAGGHVQNTASLNNVRS